MSKVDKPTSYGNKDWHLGLRLSWRIREGSSETIDCTRCNGKGGWKAVWGSYDNDWQLCDECFGGQVKNPDCLPVPGKIPDEWVRLMFKTSREFIARKSLIKRRYLTKGKG